MRDTNQQIVLHCWHDFGTSTCMLAAGHDEDHVPTPDDEIRVSLSDDSTD